MFQNIWFSLAIFSLSACGINTPQDDELLQTPATPVDYPFIASTVLQVDGAIIPKDPDRSNENQPSDFGDSLVLFRCLDSKLVDDPYGYFKISFSAKDETGAVTQEYKSTYSILCTGKIGLDISDIKLNRIYEVSVEQLDKDKKTIKKGKSKSFQFADKNNPQPIKFEIEKE